MRPAHSSRISRLVLLAGLVLPLSLLTAAVDQRVCVLRFESTGFTDSFLPVYIRNVIERELDRSGRLNLIREYLWSKFAETVPSSSDPAGLSGFAMQVKVEAVVCGSIERDPAGRYIVATKVFDALSSRTVLTDRFTTVLSNLLFAEVEDSVRRTVTAVTTYFKPMEPTEIVKYRKLTKKVFISGADIPDWALSFGAGADAVKPMAYLPWPVTNNSTVSNTSADRSQFAAFRFISDIRWRRWSFKPEFGFGATPNSRHLLISLGASYWFVPETLALGLDFLYFSEKFTGAYDYYGGSSQQIEVLTEAGWMAVNSRFKASPRVGFGLGATVPVPLFGKAVLGGTRYPLAVSPFPSFLIYADFGITRSLILRLNVDALFAGFRYGIDTQQDMSFLSGLTLSWRFDPRGKKP